MTRLRQKFAAGGNRLIAAAVCTAVTTLALPVATVHADNSKVYPAMMCQQSGTAAEPYRHAAGAYNYTANTGFVFCPMIKDEVGSTLGVTNTYVYFYKPATTAAFSCTLYSRNEYATGGYTQYRQDVLNIAGNRYLSFSPLAGYSAGHYFLGCWLPPNSGVISYQMNERS